jgi:hypothetical protein
MRPSLLHSFTRTTESRSTRGRTTRSSRATAARSPSISPSDRAGSIAPTAIAWVSARASRMDSAVPVERNANTPPTITTTSVTSPVSANCRTGRPTLMPL